MVISERVSFSGENRSLEKIAFHYLDTNAALLQFFSSESDDLIERYAGEKLENVRKESLKELDTTASFSVLSSVEAALRVDYLSRAYARKKDNLSSLMRDIYLERGNSARLDEDLLIAWREKGGVPKALISDLVGAFKYRNWIAHGRYWTPKLGRVYDYYFVYAIAEQLFDAMQDYAEKASR